MTGKPVEKIKTQNFKPHFRFSLEPESALEGDFGIQRVRKTPDRIEDYANRTGYDPVFIDGKTRVELPALSDALKRDAATFAWNGQETHELKYMHFSTAVSKSRRMPIFSACNIDGTAAKTVVRTNVWKLDPRIPVEYQILHEVYGNQREGYFSRGHMTRRQDPDWGPEDIAAVADADTFHATNAAPQVQRFNGGLWGSIEHYILANTKHDHMRLCVFTGPVFQEDDPLVHGVQIPARFWKVIAFVHDETGRITATGYVGSQAAAIAELKPKATDGFVQPMFVFGEFKHQQRPLKAIEALAQLSFGALTQCDALAAADVRFAAALQDVREIMLA